MVSESQKIRFEYISQKCSESEKNLKGIGTFNEKTMHRVLKCFFDEDETHYEIPYGNYVADIKNGNKITEIQTSGLSLIYDRLEFFLENCDVTAVVPIIYKKKIIWVNPDDGSCSTPKTSPKKGTFLEILPQLYKYSELIEKPNFTIICILINADEYRIQDGWGNDGKRGCHRMDRIPLGLVDMIHIRSKEDIKRIIPFEKDEEFSSKIFANKCGFSKKSSRDISISLKFLMNSDIIERVGKKRNSFIYKIK